MSDTARDYQTIPAATTDGMEDLFEPLASPAQPNLDHGQATPDQEQLWSIDQAAKFLKVSPRTVLRRLQKGTLGGSKIQGQFGPEWRVLPLAIPAQPSSSQAQVTPIQVWPTLSQPEPPQANPELVAELRQQVADLKAELNKKLADAQREIQAAAFRNGYLESQLEAERHQIKLLTDSQHKDGSLWAKFSSWFFKAQ